MTFYALIANDKPGHVEQRIALRPDHLKFLESLGAQLKLAGPFLDEAGNMVGSIVVIEADSLEAAETAFRRDPYYLGRLFESVTIKPWRLAINKL
jgi:uncharacterized protein YciI